MSYYLRTSSNLSYNMTLPYPYSNFLIYEKNFSQFSIKEKKLVLSFRIVPRIVWYISLRHRVNSWLLLRASMRIKDEFATSFALFMLLLAERMKIWKLIFLRPRLHCSFLKINQKNIELQYYTCTASPFVNSNNLLNEWVASILVEAEAGHNIS